MNIPISGYIDSPLDIEKKVINGVEHNFISGTINEIDSYDAKKENPIKLTFIAWDKQAEELKNNYKMQDLITCSCDFMSRKGEPVMLINRIDKENKIAIEMSNVLKKWETGEIERIDIALEGNKIPTPTKTEDRMRDTSVDEEKEKHKE